MQCPVTRRICLFGGNRGGVFWGLVLLSFIWSQHTLAAPPMPPGCLTDELAPLGIEIKPPITDFVVNTSHDLVLQLSSSSGNPIASALVVIDVSQPEARREDALQTLVEPLFQVANTDGEISVNVSVGHTAGPFELAVMAGPLRSVCHLMALPDRDQVSLIEVAGNDQVAAPGEELALPLVSRLEDQFGNPLANEEVTAEVIQGEGALQLADMALGIRTTSQVSGQTNGQGEVGFSLRVGPNDVVTRVSAFVQAQLLFQTTVGFATLVDIAVEQNGALVVVDEGLNGVIRVDPKQGNRTLVSGRLRGRGRPLAQPQGVAVASDGSLVVVGGVRNVAGGVFRAVTRLNPVDGDRTVISAASDPNDLSGLPIGTGPGLQRPRDIAVGRAGTLWVVDGADGLGLQAVVKLEQDVTAPNVWHRTLFSGFDRELGQPIGRGPGFFFSPREIVSMADDTLFVVGLLSELPGVNCFSSTEQEVCFEGIVQVDEAGNRTLVAREGPAADRIVRCPELGPLGPLGILDGLAIEAPGTLVVLSLGGSSPSSVRRVVPDVATLGNSCLLSRAPSANGPSGIGEGEGLMRPTSVAIEADGHLVVVDALLNAVIRVAPDTGARTVLSRGRAFGQGRSFLSPVAIAVAADGGVIAVDDQDTTVVRINPASGDRTVVSGCREIGCSRADRIGDSGLPFSRFFTDVIEVNGALIGTGDVTTSSAFDPVFPAVSRVDLRDGTRQIISGCPEADGICINPMFGNGPPLRSQLTALAVASDQAVVALSGRDEAAVVQVSLATGNRTVVSGCLEPDCTAGRMTGSGPSFEGPNSLALLGDDYWVVDGTLAAVVRVDAVTGNRVIASGRDPATGQVVGRGPLFSFPFAMAVENERTVIVMSTTVDFTAAVRVDVTSGDRTIVSSNPPGRNLPVKRIEALAYWGAEGAFMLADRGSVLWRLTVEGEASLAGFMDHRSDGLAFSTDAMPVLYSISQADNQLRVVDPIQGVTQSAVAIALDSQTVSGAHGLAAHPNTGELWTLLDLAGTALLTLARLDPITGIARRIGDTNVHFSGLAFDVNGTLYGVAEDVDRIPGKRLFVLSTTDATSTCVAALNRGDSEDAIAFHSLNGRLYRALGEFIPIFESIDLAGLSTCDTPAVALDIPLFFLGRGRGPLLAIPARLAIEANGDIVVTDRGLQAVLRIDAVTGDRTILSR